MAEEDAAIFVDAFAHLDREVVTVHDDGGDHLIFAGAVVDAGILVYGVPRAATPGLHGQGPSKHAR